MGDAGTICTVLTTPCKSEHVPKLKSVLKNTVKILFFTFIIGEQSYKIIPPLTRVCVDRGTV